MSSDKTDDEEIKNIKSWIFVLMYQQILTTKKHKRIVTGKENSLTSAEHRLLVSEAAGALL